MGALPCGACQVRQRLVIFAVGSSEYTVGLDGLQVGWLPATIQITTHFNII